MRAALLDELEALALEQSGTVSPSARRFLAGRRPRRQAPDRAVDDAGIASVEGSAAASVRQLRESAVDSTETTLVHAERACSGLRRGAEDLVRIVREGAGIVASAREYADPAATLDQ